MEEKNKHGNEEIKIEPIANVPAEIQKKPKASGLGGLVPAGGKVKKSAAKHIVKII